jgi:uncharacterized membrane protein YczE
MSRPLTSAARPFRALVRPIRQLSQLIVGLVLYGVSAGLQLRSGLGLDPWDVFHQGVSGRLGISIGAVVIIVGALVLLAWIPLRQWPGVGTVANVIVLGISLDVFLSIVPAQHDMAIRIAMMIGGVASSGAATGLYICAGLGPGPRDGLMTGLVRRTGGSTRLIRTGIECCVLIVGWALGGTVGIGTVLYPVAIGPLAQVFLRLFAISGVPLGVAPKSGGDTSDVADQSCGVTALA